jgi:hypothetical protein
VIVGDPFTHLLIGPSSGAWRRGEGDYGRAAYFIIDAGTVKPKGWFPSAREVLLVQIQSINGVLKIERGSTAVSSAVARKSTFRSRVGRFFLARRNVIHSRHLKGGVPITKGKLK